MRATHGQSFKMISICTTLNRQLIQKRVDSSLTFNVGMDEYKNGFGLEQENFWIGLNSLHELTWNKNVRLKIFIEYFTGEVRVAVYNRFSVGDEESDYRLYIGSFIDSESNHGLADGTTFLNKNRVFDCLGSGGWWYGYGVYSNLNANYGETTLCSCIQYFSEKCIRSVSMKILFD